MSRETTGRHVAAWPEALVVLVLAFLALPGFMPLREPGAPWHPGYAALALLSGLVSLAVLAYAAHRCRLLWRLPPHGWSRADHVGVGLVVLGSVLLASGPLTIGRWSWWSAVMLVLAAFLVVAQVRAAVGRRVS